MTEDDLGGYGCGMALVGVPVFFACWAYAIAAYGWFLGLGLGWLPAAFIGVIAGALWPVVLLAIAVIGFMLWRSQS